MSEKVNKNMSKKVNKNMSKKVNKKRPFTIDSQPFINSSDSEANDDKEHSTKRTKPSTSDPTPSGSNIYPSDENQAQAQRCPWTDSETDDDSTILNIGSIYKRSLKNVNFVTEIFSKICGPHNVVYISDVLKEWIERPYDDYFVFTSIPLKLLDKFVYVDEWRTELYLDTKLQKKFVHYVIKVLLKQVKSQYVHTYVGDLNFESQCFRKGAALFNSNNLNLFSTVTEENLPEIETVNRMFKNAVPDPNFITPNDVEMYRQYFLSHYETDKLKKCDCCIQMYIKEDLAKHEDEQFKRIFPQLYRLEGLSKIYTKFKNLRDFITDSMSRNFNF